ncbi:unnamed protein product [Chrysoparadoxa australica]
MVREGAGQLLVWIATNAQTGGDNRDLCHRISGAIRNLVRITGNHIQLAAEGVIPVLVQLAQMGHLSMRQNCAAALRSLTFKEEVRSLLIEGGAIKVILEDAQMNGEEDDLSLGTQLLCEIEAESWVNGTRGILIETRAPPFEPLPFDLSLVEMCQKEAKAGKAFRGPKLQTEHWPKILNETLLLDEPELDMGTSQARSFAEDMQTESKVDTELVKTALIGMSKKIEPPETETEKSVRSITASSVSDSVSAGSISYAMSRIRPRVIERAVRGSSSQHGSIAGGGPGKAPVAQVPSTTTSSVKKEDSQEIGPLPILSVTDACHTAGRKKKAPRTKNRKKTSSQRTPLADLVNSSTCGDEIVEKYLKTRRFSAKGN